MGNKIQETWALDFASVTEGTFKTGLSQVESAVFNNETTEAQGLVKRNTTDGSTASSGSVYVSGVTASDVGTLVVTGY
jgi:hypothetical protein